MADPLCIQPLDLIHSASQSNRNLQNPGPWDWLQQNNRSALEEKEIVAQVATSGSERREMLIRVNKLKVLFFVREHEWVEEEIGTGLTVTEQLLNVSHITRHFNTFFPLANPH